MSTTPPASNTQVTQRPEKPIVHDTSRFQNLMDSARFDHIQRVGTMYANSNLVPDHFKGKQADCVIAVEMALRLDVHPFTLMQAMYVVHGKPGIEAKLAIALINQSGIFSGPLQFKLEGAGMSRKCTAFQAHKATNQVCEAVCTMEMAKAEGWIDKAGSKWKTLPDMMLQYRAASFFGRLYCPEVLFGMQTTEELREIDVTPPEEVVQGSKPTFRERTVGKVVDVDPAPDRPEPAKANEQADAAAAPAPAAPAPKRKASKEPAIPFDHVREMADKTTGPEQADLIRDLIRDPGYTDEQRKEVTDILATKEPA